MEDLLGQKLAHFRIETKLGEGGMGAVYRATDEKLCREVALKVLPDGLGRNASRRERFLREARSAAAATHPCIATVHEIGEADGHAFIAMELVRGITLRARLGPPGSHLPVEEAVRVARDIARGLAKAHECGVVHRDLKPENVMVTADGDVKILDFGIAKLVAPEARDVPTPRTDRDHDPGSQLTGAGALIGTAAYMSPEQAAGREVDARSDVFSFGIMLYEMLAGVRPFQGDNTITLLYAVLNHAPVPVEQVNPEVPADVAAVVARCLARAPAARFASGGELRAALDALSLSEHFPRSTVSLPPLDISSAKLLTEAGVGVELAATLTPDALLAPAPAATKTLLHAPAVAPVRPPLVASPPPPAARLHPGARMATGLALTLVVGAAALALAAKPRHGQELRADTEATASAEPSSRPKSAEAALAYAQANEAFAAGDKAVAMAGWERAIAKDPTLCAARLRIAANQEGANARARDELEKIRGCEASLTPHDRALAGVIAAFSDPTVPDAVKVKAGTSAADAFPRSAEIAYYLAEYFGDDVTAPAETLRWADRAIAADPTFALAYALRIESLRTLHRQEEALAAAEACFAHRPDARACAERKFNILAHEGACSEAESYARGLIARRPSAVFPREMLTRLLLGSGLTTEAIPALERQADELRPPEDAPSEIVKLRRERQLAVVRGDFTAALDANAKAEALEGTRVDAFVLWQYALQRARLWRESGRLDAARDAMKEFLARLPAAELDEAFQRDSEIEASELAYELGLVPRSRIEEASEKALKLFPVNDPFDRWTVAYLPDDPLPEQAREAARAAPPRRILEAHRQSVVDIPNRAFRVGVNLLVAGKAAAARPWLEQAAKACTWDWRTEPIMPDMFDIQRVHGYLALGEAREQTGDVAGAKEAYAEVVRRWGEAKPRSVSSEKAKARLAALR